MLVITLLANSGVNTYSFDVATANKTIINVIEYNKPFLLALAPSGSNLTIDTSKLQIDGIFI